MLHGSHRGRLDARSGAAALALVMLAAAPLARANDAEIVLLVGKGDARETADAAWRPAAVKQKLVAGNFVRTGEMSQMGLLLRDRTQVRLSQLSILNIRSVNAAAPPPATQLELPQGRAWSQAKPKAPDASAKAPSRLNVTMPGGTAAIRGTDWELVVEKDGTSTVTVFSGQVDFYNEHGAVSVMPNEQARAVPGKAPVKILLTNAAERMQWVTAWRPQPRRWVKDLSGGFEPVVKNIETGEFVAALSSLEKMQGQPATAARAAVLLADLQLYQGLVAEAVKTLTPHASDPVAAALLVRAHLIAGNFTEAGRVLYQAEREHRGHVEVLLAQAEYARLLGDEPSARAAYRKAIESDPNNAEAWYGIGRIETEREYVKAAREALDRALRLQPDGPGYAGELASLETFANEFQAAEKAFQAALEKQPDDYVALTGLGVLQLKRGQPEAALESFLKAGLIEPRYARAHLFSAAAYYELRDGPRAVEALKKASSLDDKDPLPYLMESLVHFDALELGKAIDSARAAQARMGYVKSLNQLMTDQRGSANVGSALAAFGMEEWAQAYAYDSYSPYWAGSHLFLADRFSGTFNKNSELFKGFLSDPSVFGASNRFSSLVPVPGHYGTVGVNAGRDYMTDAGVGVSANGYSVALRPFSYFVGADWTEGDSRINRNDENGRIGQQASNLLLGLGLRATHELSLFAFANTSDTKGRLYGGEPFTGDDFTRDYRRVDAGVSYRFSPTNQAWFKAGDGSEKLNVAGPFFLAAFGTLSLHPFSTDQSQNDVQLRHTFDASREVQVTWGLERTRSERPFLLAFTLPGLLTSNLNQDNRIEADSAYVSGRFKVSQALEAQVDLHYQETQTRFSVNQTSNGALIRSESGGERFEELNPRIGLKWRPVAGQTVRMAGQIWRRPAAVNTLAPVDTVGIPLDDQIERDGGRLKRARVQHEIEFGRATFFQWFADYKEVRNPDDPGDDIVSAFGLDQLEQLRNRRRSFGVRQEFLEDTPKFEAGRIRQLGVAANQLLARDWTLAARYIYSDTENTSGEFAGRLVPYHPRHYGNVAVQWQPYRRWVIGPMVTYRSTRYQDEENSERLNKGLTFGFSAYWESADKRWSAAFVIDHVPSSGDATIYRDPLVQFQAAYRF